MARRKRVNIRDGIDRRETGYFSTPSFVAEYLGNEMLLINPNGKKALDPAVGKEELLSVFLSNGMDCCGYDIQKMKTHYGCSFIQQDFLEAFINDAYPLMNAGYDYIILNPPYNCHECTYINANKATLKRYFNVGTFNMFALFLSAAIDIAKEGCLIGAILPDAFLYEKSYEALRRKTLQDCTILQLILCPDDLFHRQLARVSSCILIMRKSHKNDDSETMLVSDRPHSSVVFKKILANREMESVKPEEALHRHNGHTRFIISKTARVVARLLDVYPSLSSMYKCGGGISTGNNGSFTSEEIREGFSVPYLTNPASSRFTATPNLYLCDDYVAQSKKYRTFIIRNKECLDREGIACSGIGKHFGAVYLPSDFVTGMGCSIWPPKEDILWLLAYMNSSLVTYILKGVLDRGNMTSIGSVNSLPVLDFSKEEKCELEKIADNAMKGIITTIDAVEHIDCIVFTHINMDETLQSEILRFCSDLTHNV